MLAHDNRIIILPKHKTIFIDVFKNIFVGRNIEIRVNRMMVNTEHFGFDQK
jgi:hypothetical protein